MWPSHETYIAQLARLASQHHASEYNRAKFGPRGYLAPYLPLSLHAPEQFRDLRQRQESYGISQPWWTCDALPEGDEQCLAPVDVVNTKLQQELIAVMDTPLEPNTISRSADPAHTIINPYIKTSASHPINVSSLVPTELIPLVSSHMVLTSSRSAVPVLELPSQFHLHRLVNTSQPMQTQNPTHISGPSISDAFRWRGASSEVMLPRLPPPSPPPPSGLQSAKSHIRTRSSMTRAMQAAINTGLTIYPPESRPPLLPLEPPPLQQVIESRRSPQLLKRHDSPTPFSGKTVLFQHSNDSAVSLSLSLSIINSALDLDLNVCGSHTPSSVAPSTKQVDLADASALTRARSFSNLDTPDSHTTASTPALTRSSTLGGEFPSDPFVLGNLFMSSCPGKKVRLQGPIKGRTGVCRDLRADLNRIRSLGVKCIICCLDDEELEYLGAPWHEYLEAAHRTGIDVLRIPIPEGLAPLDPPSLDKLITELIQRYTINGISTLVHCRGGVGRAGVIACCWIAKLGLCGWLDVPPEASGDYMLGKGSKSDERSGGTLPFVERIIGFVRQRRSLKAVETYEQVCFLVQYVDYLHREHARLAPLM